MRRLALLLAVTAALGASAETGHCGSSVKLDAKAPAFLFENLGSHHLAVTTGSPEAQRFFDQGLTLAWSFNHAEALRSFQAAALRDPGCAMAWWGQALVQGPNINAAMEPAAIKPALAALQRAQQLASRGQPWEQALIGALAQRYHAGGSHDAAYAEAMAQVAKDFPEHPEILTLAAEAAMDVHPWDYWKSTGEPQPWTATILVALDRALELAPDHPGANHLLIHAVEASRQPERAQKAAERLPRLVPGAGHMVHMPSHIYIRVGEYELASQANEEAIQADNRYMARVQAEGIYPLAYRPHNHHFLWATTMLEGRGRKALKVARELASLVDRKAMREAGWETLQHYWVSPLYSLVRFERWDDLLEEPAPPEELVYPRAVWHYAHGLALAHRGRPATQDLEQLRRAVADPRLKGLTVWGINSFSDILAVAEADLAGQLAWCEQRLPEAQRELERAVALQDALRYNEPPDYFYPVRQALGALLQERGQPAAAEAAYRLDLEKNPNNGWSLLGLAQSLEAQGKPAEDVRYAFEAAWRNADFELTHSWRNP